MLCDNQKTQKAANLADLSCSFVHHLMRNKKGMISLKKKKKKIIK